MTIPDATGFSEPATCPDCAIPLDRDGRCASCDAQDAPDDVEYGDADWSEPAGFWGSAADGGSDEGF